MIIGQIDVLGPRHVHVAVAVLVERDNAKVDVSGAAVLGEYVATLALEVNHFLIESVIVRIAIDSTRAGASTLPGPGGQHVTACVVIVGATVAHFLAMGIAGTDGVGRLAVPILTGTTLRPLGTVGAKTTLSV